MSEHAFAHTVNRRVMITWCSYPEKRMAYVNEKGLVKSIDDKGNLLIDLDNGTQMEFIDPLDNLVLLPE